MEVKILGYLNEVEVCNVFKGEKNNATIHFILALKSNVKH